MKTYWNYNAGLTLLKEWQPNCWIQVTCPTDEDRMYLENEFKIPDYFLTDIIPLFLLASYTNVMSPSPFAIMRRT